MSKLRSSKKDDDMKNILGQPFVYVDDDFNSIYSLEEYIDYDSYICAEKATGIKYLCLRFEKNKFVDDIIKTEMLRRNVEIWEHTMKSKKKQQIYYPNNNNNNSILEFKAAYEDDDCVYLVIELCSEDGLHKWVNGNNSGKELEAAYLFWQVLNAVHSFHSMGVMLRTLDHTCFLFPRPEDKGNLLNIKAFVPADAVFMNEGNLYDSLVGDTMYYYKAPEMMNDQNNYGKEVDIWAAGAILYWLLTCNHLDLDATVGQNDIDDWINEDLSGKPDAAKDLLKKMLKLDPKQRITAAEALEHPWLKFVSLTEPDSKQVVKLRTFSSMIEVLAKSLSEEENQRLKRLLNNMDTYGNTMTLEELKIGLSPLSSTLSESQMKKLNHAVDDIFTLPVVTKIMHCHQLENENIHKAFQFFDKDGDGFITRDDLGQALLPYHIASEAAINEIIDDVDTSKDGKINYSEFKAMIKEEMPEYAQKQRKLEF